MQTLLSCLADAYLFDSNRSRLICLTVFYSQVLCLGPNGNFQDAVPAFTEQLISLDNLIKGKSMCE